MVGLMGQVRFEPKVGLPPGTLEPTGRVPAWPFMGFLVFCILNSRRDERVLVDFPLLNQTENWMCVRSCWKMMLDYANKHMLTEPKPSLDEEVISEIVNTTRSGACLMNVAY